MIYAATPHQGPFLVRDHKTKILGDRDRTGLSLGNGEELEGLRTSISHHLLSVTARLHTAAASSRHRTSRLGTPARYVKLMFGCPPRTVREEAESVSC
ncbi:hypothetical protein E2C01_046742 [Portunus trituberculatus]|uniref:Uncharacterized protein n=1 Tax=Portunus trituberculatus TaxID=210409 RepID=A0A5B7G6I0_PORTR|nr:hypothetical protein [Portunus trituberculatus]